jgi:hypothetical protein
MMATSSKTGPFQVVDIKGGLFFASKSCRSVLSGAILVIVGHTFRPSCCETCVATVCWRLFHPEERGIVSKLSGEMDEHLVN